ncbi:MAG TPA: metal-dependent hydrolase [Candidatus Paceibacterota bacterium]|nr:metal-dependent hydrolase [Candidatus Paceibacterota bacterium]
MDCGSHFLSGIAIAIALPDDPDPVKNYIQKGLVVVGSVVADIPVPFIWKAIGKITMKSVRKMELNEHDWNDHAPRIGWYKIYKTMHSFLFLFLIGFIEMFLLGNLFFSLGLLIHQLYDLPTHKYENRETNPQPLWPLSDIAFTGGLTNGWAWQVERLVSWDIHFIVICAVLFCKGYLT